MPEGGVVTPLRGRMATGWLPPPFGDATRATPLHSLSMSIAVETNALPSTSGHLAQSQPTACTMPSGDHEPRLVHCPLNSADPTCTAISSSVCCSLSQKSLLSSFSLFLLNPVCRNVFSVKFGCSLSPNMSSPQTSSTHWKSSIESSAMTTAAMLPSISGANSLHIGFWYEVNLVWSG